MVTQQRSTRRMTDTTGGGATGYLRPVGLGFRLRKREAPCPRRIHLHCSSAISISREAKTMKKTLLRKLSAVLLLLFPSSIVSFELSSARKKAWIHPNRVPLHIRCKADSLPHRSLHATSSPSADDTPKAKPKLRPGSLAAATAEQGRVPYGEESRKYRRTVFVSSCSRP
jgi:hypothetical protein